MTAWVLPCDIHGVDNSGVEDGEAAARELSTLAALILATGVKLIGEALPPLAPEEDRWRSRGSLDSH